MADDIVLPGTGETVAADDVGGKKHQRLKLSLGADGAAVDAIGVTAGLDSSGAGVQAVGVMAQLDNTSPSTVTENQFAPLRFKDASRELMVADAAATAAITAMAPNIITPADAQLTRPADATAYAIGDLIANSTTAGSVARLSWTGATKTGSGGSGRIVGFIGRKSGTVAATVRYHFLKTDHAVTNGDNGALVLTSLDVDNYLGYMDVTWGAAENVGSGGESVAKSYDDPLPYVLASGDTIYCVMQALVAFTPANAGTLGGRPIFEVRS